MKLLRNWLINGLLATLPLILTIYILSSIIGFFDSIIIKNLINENSWLNEIPGLGLIITFIMMLLIGFIATNFLGKYVFSALENLINRVPFAGSLYKLFKQIFETVLSSSSNSFKDVILIEYPRKDCWSIAFITSDTKGEIQNKTKDDVVSVFIPTTPNPTSGFLLFVPKKDLIYLNMKPEVAMKLIISGGVISSNEENQ
jgi:uncharacterized membrane protein